MKHPILLLLLFAAVACGPQHPATHVIEHRPKADTARLAAPEKEYTRIFLAGTIDMGRSEDWQAATVERFRRTGKGRYLFFNPRRAEGLDGTPEDMEYQVEWELEHLERADWIVMNILGESKSPITLLEMGLHMRSGRLLVACEPGFYRYDNVRITCRRYGVPLYDSLDELLDEHFF